MQIIKGKTYFQSPPIERIREIPERSARLYPDRDAIVYRDKAGDSEIRKVSYPQLWEDVQALRDGLLSLGLAGGHIAVVGDNSYPWMLAYLGTVSGAGVCAPLDRLLPGEELALLLKRGEIALLFLDAQLMPALIDEIGDCPSVRYCVGMQQQRHGKAEDEAAFRAKVEAAGKKYMSFDELLALGRDCKAGPDLPAEWYPQADEMAVLLFTSGTMANAKAVMLSNRNITADVRALMETVRFKDPLHSLSLLPLHHTFENTCGFLTVLTLGGCIHIYDGLRYIAQNIQEHKVHMVIGVPTVFEMIHRRIVQTIKKQGKSKKFQFARRLSRFLRKLGLDVRRRIFKEVLAGLGGELYIAISGAANLDREVIRFFDDIGITILQGYGMTETAPVVAGCNTQFNVIGTCGQPLSGVELAVDAATPGEAGEILVRGDMVMLGYYQDEAASADVLPGDGWLRTGDIGRIDPANNCLSLTGRTKSMIVLPSGKKVFPEEIEHMLNQNEWVKESLIFGQEEKDGNVVLTAKIILDQEKLAESGENPDPETIRQIIEGYINEANLSLPSFKGIRSYVYSFRDMVKTTTLKVKRTVEIERLQEILAKTKKSWHELTGMNIDQIHEEVNKAGKN